MCYKNKHALPCLHSHYYKNVILVVNACFTEQQICMHDIVLLQSGTDVIAEQKKHIK